MDTRTSHRKQPSFNVHCDMLNATLIDMLL